MSKGVNDQIIETTEGFWFMVIEHKINDFYLS